MCLNPSHVDGFTVTKNSFVHISPKRECMKEHINTSHWVTQIRLMHFKRLYVTLLCLNDRIVLGRDWTPYELPNCPMSGQMHKSNGTLFSWWRKHELLIWSNWQTSWSTWFLYTMPQIIYWKQHNKNDNFLMAASIVSLMIRNSYQFWINLLEHSFQDALKSHKEYMSSGWVYCILFTLFAWYGNPYETVA